MTTKAQTAADKAEAIDNLRRWLKRDERIYTVLRHRAASGMTRFLDLYYIADDKTPRRITWQAAKALAGLMTTNAMRCG